MRPETERPSWRIRELAGRDYHYRHTHLRLSTLTEAESASLVGHFLADDGSTSALRARILGQAEGNPFFVEELLRELIDVGALAFDAKTGCWYAADEPAALPLPETLRGVLASRIDRLPQNARQMLRIASVIGRIVPLSLLSTIAGRDNLGDQLSVLQHAEFLRERARLPEAEYIFKHQLTLEAARASLLRRQHRALHRRVAEAIEERYADRIEERLGILAHHWEEAGDATGLSTICGEQGNRPQPNGRTTRPQIT